MKKDKIIILHNLETYDTIPADVLREIENMKLKEVLSQHPYKITEPKGEKGRWSTYVTTESGRKKIAKTSYTELINALKDYYFVKESKFNTLETLYPTWFSKKETSTKSTETLRRHAQHWRRYYEKNSIISIPLTKLTKEDVEDFFHLTIKNFHLTKKELNNMKIIFKGILKLAYDRHITSYNIWDNCTINTGLCRHVPKKSNNTQVYLPDEQILLWSIMDIELQKYPTKNSIYAIKVLFQLGVRISELVALKWSDVENDYIHVQRMEQKVSTINENGTFKPSKRIIVDHVKTDNDDGDRFLYLTETAKDILSMVKEINMENHFKDDDFIFCNANGRLTTRTIAHLLEKLCKKAGIQVKSSHDIRRTYASKLNANGVPLDEIRRALGHNDERTTLGYIFNPYSSKETNKLYENALR